MNLGEFDWKHASPVNGAITAAVHALKYLAVPYILFVVGLMVLGNQDGPQRLADLLIELQTLVLIFGIVLTVLGFLKGMYPKGSYSRFAFGITASVLVIAYVFSLLLDGRTEYVISREAFVLDLDIIFVLYFFPALLAVLMQFGEFADHRRLWLERDGQREPRELEDPQEHRIYHDFRLRYGSLFNGLKLTRSTLVGFVVLPLIIILILRAGFASLNIDEVDAMLASLDDISTYMLMLGLPMAALAFFKGFYPRGSLSRLLPAVTMVLISMYWIWVLGMEGRFLLDSIEQISIDLDFSRLLMLIMVGTALWIVYYVLEMLVHRPDWKLSGFRKDLRLDRKVRKEEEQRIKDARQKAREDRKEAKRKAKEERSQAKATDAPRAAENAEGAASPVEEPIAAAPENVPEGSPQGDEQIVPETKEGQ